MAKTKHSQTEESGPKVPGYIVTFSDMVTLLLTFFVMLLSLAAVQDEELFNRGRDSFSFAIKNFGLGMLWGRKLKPDFGNVKIKHFISKPDEFFKGRSNFLARTTPCCKEINDNSSACGNIGNLCYNLDHSTLLQSLQFTFSSRIAK